MRRHRPINAFCAAHDEDEAADDADYSAPIRYGGGGGGGSSVSAILAGEKSATESSNRRTRLENNAAGGRESHERGGASRRSTELAVSPLSLHATHPSSVAGGAVPSRLQPQPQHFYDGPSLLHSIPALLQQLTKASSAASLSSSTATAPTSAAIAEAARKERRMRHGSKTRPRKTVGNTEGRRPGRTNSSASTSARSPTPPRVAAASARESAASAQVRHGGHTHEHTGGRGGMRYVVVQQPAMTGSHTYTLPAAWTSPDSTRRLPAVPAKAPHVALAEVSPPPAAESEAPSSCSSSTHTSNSATESREQSRDSSSAATSRRSPAVPLPAKHHREAATINSEAEPETRWSSTRESFASPAAVAPVSLRAPVTAAVLPSSGSSRTVDEHVASHSTRSSIRSSGADTHSAFTSAGSSLHASSSSKSHMRHLFATLLDKSRTNPTPPVSAHASTLMSDEAAGATAAVQSPYHAYPQRHEAGAPTIVSPLPRPPVPLRGTVVGGVESRGASPASRGYVNNPLPPTPAGPAPFEDAVMEGGDPLVLRHTIDYLLAKARRLEAQNAALWVQGHSWNPRRSSVGSSETVAAQPTRELQQQPQPQKASATVRATPPSAQPSTSRVTRATGTGGTQTRAAVVAATQTEHAAPLSQEHRRPVTRVFVQRQPRTATTTSAAPVDGDVSSERSSSASSIDGSPLRSPVGVFASEDVDNSRCATPRPTQRSVTVSSPSATMEASVTAAVQRAEMGVQHEATSRDVGTTTTTSTVLEKPTQPPQPPTRSTAATQHTAVASQLPSSAATPTGAARRVASTERSRSHLASSPRTPPLRAAHVVLEGNNSNNNNNDDDDDAFGTTLLASTVRSHHSVESRRSVGSMAHHTHPNARVAPLHASALRATSAPLHTSQTNQSHRLVTEERAISGGNAASNASFTSMGGRSTTHNKQVQTASILSPPEEDSEGETLLDAHLDAGTTASLTAERTAVIELHTSASYTRNTVRRLRAYCSELESTRQQLRRRVVRTPTSLAASATAAASSGSRWASSVAAAAATTTSSRSSSPGVPLSSSLFPPPRPSSSLAPSPTISRPFFATEYADPEVDATLHDVEETPAMDTMIVLQEDGSGTVSKRVVDGSPSRVSTPAGRSPSPTAHAQPRRRRPDGTPTASSVMSFHGLELEEAYAPSSSRANSQPFFLSSSSYGTHDRAGGHRHRSREETAAALLGASLRSDAGHQRGGGGHVREVTPSVQLGRSTRSDSAVSWPASEQREGHSPDVPSAALASAVSGPAVWLVMSGRFALPHAPAEGPAAAAPVMDSSSAGTTLLDAPPPHPPSAPPHSSSNNNADERFAPTMPPPPPSASVETLQQLATSAAPPGTAATVAASAGSSSRFAVPDANTSDAVVRTASRATSSGTSSGSSIGRSRSRSSEGRLAATPTPSQRPAFTPPTSAAPLWNPAANAVTTQRAPEQLTKQKREEADPLSRVHGGALLLLPPPTFVGEDADSTSPINLAATSAASFDNAAHSNQTDAPLLVGDGLHRHDGSPGGPSSPAPHSPHSSRRSATQDAAHDGSGRSPRSITVEFVDEAVEAGRQQLYQIVPARGVTWSPPGIATTTTAGAAAGDESGGDVVDDADKFLVSERMPIDRDGSDTLDAGRVEVAEAAPLPPVLSSATRVRLISPSPPRRAAAVAAAADAVEATASSEEEADPAKPLDISDAASSRRHRTMPPMQRPPVAPSRVIVLQEDTSPSASLSRSLYSFSSSASSEAGEASDGEDEEALHHSEWF